MRSKHATWRPVPYVGLHARTRRRAVIIHTNGGGSDNGSLHGWWVAGAHGDHGHDNRHVGAQFQVMANGHAEQYVDTDLVVYHAYDASEWAVGIETEDDGHPERPWTDAQCQTIIAICRELHVPPKLLRATSSDGVGWHEQYADWNKLKHGCPGHVREQQIHDVILPALRSPTPKPKPPSPHPTPQPKEGKVLEVIRVPNTQPQFLSDGMIRRWIEDLNEKRELVALGFIKSVDDVKDVSAATMSRIALVGKAPPQ